MTRLAALALVAATVLTACPAEPTYPRCDDDAHPCPPLPNYPTSDRDGMDTAIGRACQQLRRIGCPEGFRNRSGRTCFESYTAAARLASVPAACLIASTSESDVKGCGNENTVRVRCVLPTADTIGSVAP